MRSWRPCLGFILFGIPLAVEHGGSLCWHWNGPRCQSVAGAVGAVAGDFGDFPIFPLFFANV